MKTIVLVSCTSRKKEGRHKAQDLYDSTWFKKAYNLVTSMKEEWYIISAKHGLLHPEQKIDCYNESLFDMSKREKEAWANKVLIKLLPLLKSGDKVVIFAGEIYRGLLIPDLEKHGVIVEIPTKGLPIGKQLHWLEEEYKKIKAS